MDKRVNKKTVEPPESLWDIIKLIIKGLPKALLWRLPIILLIVPVVFILHTFLLVYCNEGFSGGGSWFLDHVLCLQGRRISGMLFWFMLSAIIPTVIKGVWHAGGPVNYISGVFSKLGEVIKSFKTAENTQMPFLLGGIAGYCFLSWFWQNGLVNIMILLFILRGLLALSAGSFLYILAKCAQNDFYRIFKSSKPVAMSVAETFYLYAGISIAIILTLLPKLEQYSFIVGVICVVMILINRNKYKPQALAGIIIFFSINSVVMLLLSNGLLADDGGWQECGGTFDRWIKSEGAIIAMLHGIPPSFAVALGTLLGGTADATVGALTDVVATSTAGTTSSAVTPVMDSDPNKGWVYSEEYGRLVPTEGARDSQGRVYRKVPWDESGYAFVDAEESERLEKMSAAGLGWDRNHGYVSSEDLAKYKKQCETNRIAYDRYYDKLNQDFADSQKRLDAINRQKKVREIQEIADKLRDGELLDYNEQKKIQEFSNNASEDFKKYVRGEPVTISNEVPGSYDGTVKVLKLIKYINDSAAGAVADVAKLNPATRPLGYAFEYGYIAVTNNAGGVSQALADYSRGKGAESLTGALYKGVNNGMKSTVFDSATNFLISEGSGKLFEKFGVEKLLNRAASGLPGANREFLERSAESVGKYIAKHPGKEKFYTKLLLKTLAKGGSDEVTETVFKSVVKKALNEPYGRYLCNPLKADFTK